MKKKEEAKQQLMAKVITTKAVDPQNHKGFKRFYRY